MSNALPESTLAWLQEAAAVGIAEPMVLCHLLKRVEALETRLIPGAVEIAALPSEAAPVATDRRHGAAQPPVAPPAPEPAPEPRNPTMDEVLDLAKSLQLEVNDCDALLWLVVTAIAAWGDASAAPQAPGVREVGLLVDRLNQVAGDFDFLCNKALETAGAMRRAATLLQQFSAITTEDLKND